jgi:hypothetical protein
MMRKYDLAAQRDIDASMASRRARLQALLFAGATCGTKLVAFGVENPKLPIGLGE